jgi:hypothetical protein
MGPPGLGSSQYGSRYSMSRTCGPRDIISLVIPRLGDNNHQGGTNVSKEKKSTRTPLGRDPLVGILKNFGHIIIMHMFFHCGVFSCS